MIEFGVAAIAGIVVLLAASIVQESISSFRLTVVMATVAWALVAHAGAFKVAISMEDWQVVPTVAVASLIGFISTAFGELLFRQSVHSFAQYLMSSLVTFAALAAGVLLARQIIRSIWLNGNLRTTAVVVGNEFTTHELVIELRDHQQHGIDIVGEVGTANDGSLARLVSETRPGPGDHRWRKYLRRYRAGRNGLGILSARLHHAAAVGDKDRISIGLHSIK